MKYVSSLFFLGAVTLFFSHSGMGQQNVTPPPPPPPEPATLPCAGSDICDDIIKTCKQKCEGASLGASRAACEKKKNCDKKTSYDYKGCMKSLGCYPAETSPSYTPPPQPGAPTVCAGRDACSGIIKLCKDKCSSFMGNARDNCEKEKQCNETNYDFKSCMELVGCGPKEAPGGTPNYFLPNQKF